MDAPAPARGCANCGRLQAQVEQLQALVAQLQQQVRELQARLDQNSSNSHKPPSSDPPWAGKKPPARKPTGKPRGGQPGHQGHHRKRLPPERVDQVVDHIPTNCRRCDAPLNRQPSPADPEPGWHQVAELPEVPAAVVTEHRAHARACPCCGTITRAAIPREVRRHVIGPRLAALMSYLRCRCHNGKRVVREVLADLFDVPLALGSISAYERQMAAALAAGHRQAMEQVRKAGAKNVDETGWTEAGQRRWLWAAATRTAACFLVHRRRNRQALGHLLGSRPGKGIVCSDRHSAYLRLPLSRRQLCWAHLRREGVKWQEKSDLTRVLGDDLLQVCRGVFARWRDFRQGRLTRRQLQRRAGPLRRRLDQLLRWHRRCADPKAAEFCRRLLRVQRALWTFTRVDGVEPTNNHAERTLRLAVTWRKNSFGSASDGGLRFAERMLTAIQTLRLQGRRVLAWLQDTLTAHRQDLPTPNLC